MAVNWLEMACFWGSRRIGEAGGDDVSEIVVRAIVMVTIDNCHEDNFGHKYPPIDTNGGWPREGRRPSCSCGRGFRRANPFMKLGKVVGQVEANPTALFGNSTPPPNTHPISLPHFLIPHQSSKVGWI